MFEQSKIGLEHLISSQNIIVDKLDMYKIKSTDEILNFT